MTEMNIEWELPSHKDFKKYAEKEGKECSITEYVVWLDLQYLMLRSSLRWHYPPEVPEDGSDVLFISGDRKLGGRYVDKFSGFTTPGVSHANVVAWCYWPIAWTALPKDVQS